MFNKTSKIKNHKILGIKGKVVCQVDKGSLVVVLSSGHKLERPGEREPQWINFLHHTGQGAMTLGHFLDKEAGEPPSLALMFFRDNEMPLASPWSLSLDRVHLGLLFVSRQTCGEQPMTF